MSRDGTDKGTTESREGGKQTVRVTSLTEPVKRPVNDIKLRTSKGS